MEIKFTFKMRKNNLQNRFSENSRLNNLSVWEKYCFIFLKNDIKQKIKSNTNLIFLLCFNCLLLFTILGCNQEPKTKYPQYKTSSSTPIYPQYHFAVHALHNPARLIKLFQPLVDHLNKHISGATIVLEASNDYASFEEKYKNKIPEIILPNPWQTIQAIKSDYTVIATLGDPEDFKGIFIIRKDSKINNPIDVKGKAISYPSPTAVAACIMPQYFLQKNGIDINKDITNMYVGSQESSILNVYHKKTAVGCTWPPPWRAFQKTFPKEASQLKVIWETKPLINNSVMIRNDIPARVKNQIQKCLLEMDRTEEGRKILSRIESKAFYHATNKTYDAAKAYLNQFEKEVREIDIKK